MNRGQWSPEFQTSLEDLLSEVPSSAAPVAVFDADGTLWGTDANENFLGYVDTHGLLPGRENSSVRDEYNRRCLEDKHAGFVWGAQIYAGLSVDTVMRGVKTCFEEKTAPFIFETMRTLVGRLHAHGWRVYVVSASPIWVILPGTQMLGIPRENVVALDVVRRDGVLTDVLYEPLSLGAGKVVCIHNYVGEVPWVAAGNSLDDGPMLEMATRLRIVVNPAGSARDVTSLRGMATGKDWHILWTTESDA